MRIASVSRGFRVLREGWGLDKVFGAKRNEQRLGFIRNRNRLDDA